MKNIHLSVLALYSTALVSLLSCSQSPADRLMKEMTLEEKIGQLNQVVGPEITGTDTNVAIEEKIREGKVGSMLNARGATFVRALQDIAVNESRLGIPILFGLDVIHGYEVNFPIPLAMSSSWDVDAVEEASAIAAREASCAGIAWTFAPMCDICRDPRWGRVAEGAGEDPYLGAQMAAAQVRGFQGNLDSDSNIAACVKHFALYGAPMAGRDYNTVEMSRQQMMNDYILPYKGAIDAGALTAMSSFNEFESVPLSLNRYMLTDLLRGKLGFDGMVVSDYTAIKECIAHGAAADLEDASIRAISAGVDMDMVDEGFVTYLAEAVKNGQLSRKVIDRACRRVLEVKERLGLFEDPYKFCREEEEIELLSSDTHLEAARRIARECIVLLKNGNGTLPLNEGKKIAVIGPLGNLPREMLGCWHVRPAWHDCVTVFDALAERFGEKNVSFATGSRIFEDEAVVRALCQTTEGMELERSEEDLRREALALARRSDVIVATMGELAYMSGEGCSRSDISIPAPQKALLKELVATGKPVVLVILAGRPLTLEWEDANVDAIVEAWHSGTEAGHAVADVLSGDFNPCGRLTVTFPRNVGQIPIFYNHKNTGRPHGDDAAYVRYRSCYADVENSPLYPFGYGLSYSEVKYGELTVSDRNGGGSMIASIPLSNLSDREVVEVVQLYIRDITASSTRPVKELKAFERLTIPAGQTATAEFELTDEDFGFWNHELEFVTEPGEFEIMAGPNSRDVIGVRVSRNRRVFVKK